MGQQSRMYLLGAAVLALASAAVARLCTEADASGEADQIEAEAGALLELASGGAAPALAAPQPPAAQPHPQPPQPPQPPVRPGRPPRR